MSNAPANKNIDRQQRFYSIKKKRQKDFSIRFAKPSRAEKAAFNREPEWWPHFVSREHPTHAAKNNAGKMARKAEQNTLTKEGTVTRPTIFYLN